MSEISETQLDQMQQQNWEVAREASRQTRADPDSPYAGKYLGIAERQIVVVADSWDELHDRLDELGYNRNQSVGIEASADYERPVMLWSPQLLTAKIGEASVNS